MVLVTEDDPGTALYLQKCLKRAGYLVLMAHTGEEAYRLAEDKRPEVIVSDISLPDMDGYEVARVLHLQTNAPVVLLSASAEFERETRFEPHAFLLKPFDEVELVTGVAGALYRSRLENSILRANSHLRSTKRELQRSNRELERFAYVASHDLQEPLRMVSSFLELLKRRSADKLDEEAKEYVEYAVDGARRMHRMIQDLLIYSRAGRPGAAAEELSLTDIVQEALTNLTALVQESGAEVNLQDLPTLKVVEGDCVRLFQNLISNAIKFRREDTPVVVDIGADETEEGWKIQVTDNGRGIAPEHLEQIFEPFFRVENDGARSGTGIGLAVCQRVAASLGGHLGVSSQPGQGSTFTLFLFEEPDAQ